MKTVIRLAGSAILLWLLSGCTNSTTVELHEPGEYKGKTDPLLQVSGRPEHEAQLRDRLRAVQTDR